ncbi:FecR domain-containing protein [Prevotella cerevisiae]|uniref:FecR domain-containing protein n=1 Tax=Segatella cerevisiae TaxID=2053716 RepID=A0ABT1BYH9_9BACT|nr:FecR domain-containing protein [Segatella cerevisiae]MCO6026142.1 FecR domain-containing protein [Segatella cerevisiae]
MGRNKKWNEILDFVVRYYKEGIFDTRKAISAFHENTGYSPTLHRRKIGIYRIVAAAAGILLLVGIGIGLLQQNRDEILIASNDSIKTLTISDGSKIIIAPHSSISYHKNGKVTNVRSVSLKGKAYFIIMHNSRNPFTVHSDLGLVEDLGTTFQIDETCGNASKVYVTSGKVRFSTRDRKHSLILTTNRTAEISKEYPQPHLIPSSHSNQTAWATGIFIFDNTPINKALKEIGNCYQISLVTSDTTRSISGEFKTKNVNDLINALEDALHIAIRVKK